MLQIKITHNPRLGANPLELSTFVTLKLERKQLVKVLNELYPTNTRIFGIQKSQKFAIKALKKKYQFACYW